MEPNRRRDPSPHSPSSPGQSGQEDGNSDDNLPSQSPDINDEIGPSGIDPGASRSLPEYGNLANLSADNGAPQPGSSASSSSSIVNDNPSVSGSSTVSYSANNNNNNTNRNRRRQQHHNNVPDEGGFDSEYLWGAASSSGSSRGGNHSHLTGNASRGVSEGPSTSSSSLAPSAGSSLSSSPVGVNVSVANFSPQPSSSDYFGINLRPTQCSSSSNNNTSSGQIGTSNNTSSRSGGASSTSNILSSSSSLPRLNRSVTSSSMNENASRLALPVAESPMASSSFGQQPNSPRPGPSTGQSSGESNAPLLSSSSSSSSAGTLQAQQPSSSPPQVSMQIQLHGEISNPPSPLGGSRPPQNIGSGIRAQKRDYPDSPIPGPSTSKRTYRDRINNFDDPIPGPSGINQASLNNSSSGGNSSEATAAIPWDGRSPLPSPPPRASLPSADNLLISSSTGMVDSVPPTPVDIHGDNDLSVPSPNPSQNFHQPLQILQHSSRRVVDMDDMVDSTVDSSGYPLSRNNEMDYSEGAEFCQSSRYLIDSSEDENSLSLQNSYSTHDDGISTSGQVDVGQFRLVPNDPEDEFFNQRNPPLFSSTSSTSSSNHQENSNRNTRTTSSSSSIYDNPVPGPSRTRPVAKGNQNSYNNVVSGSSSKSNSLNKNNQVKSTSNINYNLNSFESSSSGQLENPMPGPSKQPDKTSQENVSTVSSISNLLTSPEDDLQLDNYSVPSYNNGLESSALSSSFNNIDSVSSFSQHVDLEDIQLQKFLPEQSSKNGESSNSSIGSSAHNFSSSSKYLPINCPDLPLSDYRSSENEESLMQQQRRHRSLDQQSPNNQSSGENISNLSDGAGPSNGASLGISHHISGSSYSIKQMENDKSSHPTNGSGNSSQHSSILESMTGPLSKRLRTLHTLEQKKTNSTSSNAQLSTSMAQNEVLNPKPSLPKDDEKSDKPDKKNKKNEDNSKNGDPENKDTGLGGIQHNYSAIIETTGPTIIAKHKRLFEQKSLTEPVVPDILDKQNSILNNDVLHIENKIIAEDEDNPLLIIDNPIQSRARASLPLSHLAIKEWKNQPDGKKLCGVFAKKKIPQNCRFGPVEGNIKKINHKMNKPSENEILLLVKTIEGDFEVDTQDEEIANWMKFVRPTNNPFDQNLSLVQENGQLYYIASRSINPQQELRVSYSPNYARERNLRIPDIIEGDDDENLWPCYECSLKLQSSEELQLHLSEHSSEINSVRKNNGVLAKNSKYKKIPQDNEESDIHENRKGSNDFRCPICPKQFNKEHSLNRHVVLHQGEKKFHCDECDMSFSHPVNLSRHKKKNHNVNAIKRCSICDLSFKSSTVYQIHQYNHQIHENEYRNDGMSFQCPDCKIRFDRWNELVSHVNIHSIENGGENKQQSNNKKMFKCEICYKSFSTDERLKKHIAIVHTTDDVKPLACDYCDKRFLNNSALACHLKTHSEDNTAYDCPICGMAFNQIVNLKEHVHTHRINGEYHCPHCAKSFPEYPLIRKHIRAIHGEKKFSCTECNKSFASADKLKIHVVVHSDVREFLCNDCGRQFKRKDKLREHVLRAHTEQAKQKKAHNNNNNTSNVALNNDIPKENPKFIPKVSPSDYHRFIYKCHECLLGFKRRGMLVNHLAKRHPNISPQSVPELSLPILKATKDYYCQYCNKVYKSSSKRKAHIIKNHPGKKLPVSARSKVDDESFAVVLDDDGNPMEGVADENFHHRTFSATVGSVTSLPHSCQFCHKQYASNAKLLQHQRKKHLDKLPPEKQTPRTNGSGSSREKNKIVENGTASTSNNSYSYSNVKMESFNVGESRQPNSHVVVTGRYVSDLPTSEFEPLSHIHQNETDGLEAISQHDLILPDLSNNPEEVIFINPSDNYGSINLVQQHNSASAATASSATDQNHAADSH